MPPLIPRQRLQSFLLQLPLALLAAHQLFLIYTQYLANRFYLNDIGNVHYMLHFTLRGQFFHSLVTESNHFGMHFTPSLLLLLPFHALWNHILLIPLLQTAALLSAAWAVIWLSQGLLHHSRHFARPGAPAPLSIALGWFYLCNPFTGSILLANHFEAFAVALGLWALAALANQRHRLFWLLFFLLLGIKEDLPLYYAAFALWWLLQGWTPKPGIRHWRQRLPRATTMLLLCLAMLAIALPVMLQLRPETGQWSQGYDHRYGWLGPDWPTRLQNLIRHPWLVLQNPAAIYLMLLASVAALPLLAPLSLLLLLPPALLMGLSGADTMYRLYYYYSYPFLPFLFLATALGLRRLLHLARSKPALRKLRPATFLTLLLFVAGAWQLTLPTRTEGQTRQWVQPQPRHAMIRQAIRNHLPPTASVCAQYDLLCQVPTRPNILPLAEKNLRHGELLLLDTKGSIGNISGREYRRILDKVQADINSGHARVLYSKDGFLIIRRNKTAPR